MNPRVTEVRALDDHTLLVTFANGESRRFDMSPYFDFPAFRGLRDPAFFRQVNAANGTASWPGGIDFDPDTLFVDGVPTTGARTTAAV
jgi:hypothetical protein